ncbi:MAG: 3-phosphoshikimate 1-carboxyvinyltransferase [Chloroflexi bacterium]|nr:3-phosphoshikimate 1-carboxyvinyltransferase [Chloroflexota bacterium]
MTSLTIHPAAAPLQGAVRLSGDKSLSHRAALFAVLTQGESRIANFLDAGVTRPLLSALHELGVPWHLEGDVLHVTGRGLHGLPQPPHPPTLYCGHSATTMRLLAGFLAAAGMPAVLDGSPGLRRRPMRRITDPLRRMGVPISDTDGHAPLTLHPRPADHPLHGLTHHLAVASAQVKTALLLAALAADSPTTIVEPGPSRDHTERLFRAMGLRLEQPAPRTVRLVPPIPAELPPLRLTLPGDISSAAFLLAAALVVPGSQITLQRVLLNPTRTGFLDALQRMGAQVTITPRGETYGEPFGDITVAYTPDLHGITVRGDLVVRMVDEFPAFAIVAAAAQGETVVQDAEELRHKESDRIAAIVSRLQALGVEAQALPDGFRIVGGRPWHGAQLASGGDHRIAMAFAVAGLAAQTPITITDADIITQSFPTFASVLQTLGATVT